MTQWAIINETPTISEEEFENLTETTAVNNCESVPDGDE